MVEHHHLLNTSAETTIQIVTARFLYQFSLSYFGDAAKYLDIAQVYIVLLEETNELHEILFCWAVMTAVWPYSLNKWEIFLQKYSTKMDFLQVYISNARNPTSLIFLPEWHQAFAIYSISFFSTKNDFGDPIPLMGWFICYQRIGCLNQWLAKSKCKEVQRNRSQHYTSESCLWHTSRTPLCATNLPAAVVAPPAKKLECWKRPFFFCPT